MEVQALAEAGYREVVLLGQTVNSYRWEDVTFAALLRMVHGVEGIRRIRFVSPHPSDVTDELIETLRDYPKIARHIHLPLQSGSDRILRAMRRTYTQREYLEKVEKLRKAVPDIAIGTDIIVGFPGETEEDFQETLKVVRLVEYDSMFSFKYSPRPFTTAWKFGDPVPDGVKTDRILRLQALQEEIQLRKHRALIGSLQEVLFEGPSKKRPDELEGRTTHNRVVNVPADPSRWLGRFAWVRITEAGPHSLRGELVGAEGTDRPLSGPEGL
jgi:tRNA-2-methylthio-N6-dimethylallyladenosine synthase